MLANKDYTNKAIYAFLYQNGNCKGGDAKFLQMRNDLCYQNRKSHCCEITQWGDIYTLNCSYLCQQKHRRLKMSTLTNAY